MFWSRVLSSDRFHGVEPSFFATLGIPIVAGRPFDLEDGPEAPAVAIVSEDAATMWWPGDDPLGRQVKLGQEGEWLTVVGVSANTGELSRLGRLWDLITDRSYFKLYRPLAQVNSLPSGWSDGPCSQCEGVVLAVRGESGNVPVLRVLRMELDETATGIPVEYLGSMHDRQMNATGGREIRLNQKLVSGAAGVG